MRHEGDFRQQRRAKALRQGDLVLFVGHHVRVDTVGHPPRQGQAAVRYRLRRQQRVVQAPQTHPHHKDYRQTKRHSQVR